MKTLNELIKNRATEIINEKTEYNKKQNYQYFVPTETEIIKDITDKFNRIPLRYRDIELNDKDLSEKVKKAIKEDNGCYFFGPAGTGKTYILYGVLKRMLALGYGARLWNVPQKLAELKSEYDKNGGGESEICEILKDNCVLFLDDFGAEKLTEWNNEIMYRLINYRYENMLTTFFASNLSLQELAERNGDRLASRIAEMCNVVKIDGDDRRITK